MKNLGRNKSCGEIFVTAFKFHIQYAIDARRFAALVREESIPLSFMEWMNLPSVPSPSIVGTPN